MRHNAQPSAPGRTDQTRQRQTSPPRIGHVTHEPFKRREAWERGGRGRWGGCRRKWRSWSWTRNLASCNWRWSVSCARRASRRRSCSPAGTASARCASEGEHACGAPVHPAPGRLARTDVAAPPTRAWRRSAVGPAGCLPCCTLPSAPLQCERTHLHPRAHVPGRCSCCSAVRCAGRTAGRTTCARTSFCSSSLTTSSSFPRASVRASRTRPATSLRRKICAAKTPRSKLPALLRSTFRVGRAPAAWAANTCTPATRVHTRFTQAGRNGMHTRERYVACAQTCRYVHVCTFARRACGHTYAVWPQSLTACVRGGAGGLVGRQEKLQFDK